MLSRRQFLQAAAAVPVAYRAFGQTDSPWGGPVLDAHHHFRADLDANLRHMDGVGITASVLLTEAQLDDQAKSLMAMHPKRFVRYTSVNVARPDAVDVLRKAIGNGSSGLGELKSRVACDGPEMRRMYALAAELKVPVLLHFQDVNQQTSVGTFNTGFRQQFEGLLKEYRNTTFVGHADAFWANISAEVPADAAYPTGPVKPGGLTDRLLSDYPNLYGDLSAMSGRNSLARDPEFAGDFLKRHQNKLMFGSDCFCEDGKGKGQTNPFPMLAGKCIARETLTALQQLASPDVFRKITWQNGVQLLKIQA